MRDAIARSYECHRTAGGSQGENLSRPRCEKARRYFYLSNVNTKRTVADNMANVGGPLISTLRTADRGAGSDTGRSNDVIILLAC